MSLIEILAIDAIAVLSLMLGLWLISVFIKDVSIVDLFWGFGFVVIAWLSLILAGSTGDDVLPVRAYLITVLTTLWGLRLSIHLTVRNLGKGEDYRYAAMRERRQDSFWWISLFLVFWLQGAIMLIVALPLPAAIASEHSFGLLDAVGASVWAIGLLFEAVGDWQLMRFKANPENRGKVLDRGLWRYTRHPNYFGDAVVWWGLYLIAAAGGAWWTVAGPLLMTLFLRRVSGVTLLEKSLVKRRPGYQAYVERTSPFFPWPPRKAKPDASAISE